MADQEPEDQPEAAPLAEDQPDPSVEAPALVWISKSYEPSRSASNTDAARRTRSED